MLKPVEKKSLGTAVYEQLREAIVGGGFEAGATLPSERVLSEMLNVNRGAVREGLKRLEQAGLVAIQHGGATQVLDFRNSGGLELLGALVVREGRVDTRAARSILELRSAIGVEVVRACARRRASGDLDRIVEAMRSSKGDLPALQRLAMDFWAEVVDGADGLAWRLAFNSMARAYGLVAEHLAHVLADELTATADYAALARAIARGDEDGAVKRAQAIVGRGTRAVGEVLQALDANERKEKRR
jgi:GntR family transcriptional regulator, transcriptional repressor for pyruvate dehydrogenase complex